MANTAVIWGPNSTGLVLPKNGLVGVGGLPVAAAGSIAYTPSAGVVSTDVQSAITEVSQRADADPRSRSILFDDFCMDVETNFPSGPFGLYAFGGNGGNPSSYSSVPNAAMAGRVGLGIMGTGTTSNATGFGIFICQNSATYPGQNTQMTWELAVYTPALISTGGTTYTIELGYRSTQTAGRSTNAMAFLYDQAVSTNWAAYTSNNGTATTVTTANAAFAVAANTWYTLKMVMVSGTISFYVDYGSGYALLGTSATNLPDVSHRAYINLVIYKTGSVSATTSILCFDWMKLDSLVTR